MSKIHELYEMATSAEISLAKAREAEKRELILFVGVVVTGMLLFTVGWLIAHCVG